MMKMKCLYHPTPTPIWGLKNDLKVDVEKNKILRLGRIAIKYYLVEMTYHSHELLH